MKFLSKIFKNKTCISIYQKAKKKKPNKSERDYLKIVLLTKPPFDYQHDEVINFILDKQAKNIDELSEFIAEYGEDKSMWENRKRNMKFLSNIKNRNMKFFKKFWEN